MTFFVISTVSSNFHYLTGGPYSNIKVAQAKADSLNTKSPTYSTSFVVRRTEPPASSARLLDSKNEPSGE